MKSGLPKTAAECETLQDLREARAAWWRLAEQYDSAALYNSSRLSGVCLSDIQAKDEAHSNWKQCDRAYYKTLATRKADHLL